MRRLGTPSSALNSTRVPYHIGFDASLECDAWQDGDVALIGVVRSGAAELEWQNGSGRDAAAAAASMARAAALSLVPRIYAAPEK